MRFFFCTVVFLLPIAQIRAAAPIPFSTLFRDSDTVIVGAVERAVPIASTDVLADIKPKRAFPFLDDEPTHVCELRIHVDRIFKGEKHLDTSGPVAVLSYLPFSSCSPTYDGVEGLTGRPALWLLRKDHGLIRTTLDDADTVYPIDSWHSLSGVMAAIQCREARRLLRIIGSALANGTSLSYREAAGLFGRVPPEKHARAVAQMCDLLDAAACLAGVPLLALVAVREHGGGINPKAWKDEAGPRRDAIIDRSRRHVFSPPAFVAIGNSLRDLGARGNAKAWDYLRGLYPGDLLYRRLIGDYLAPESNAIEGRHPS